MSKNDTNGTIKLANVANFRDVGAFTNSVSGRSLLKPGLLYRSARPDFATPADTDTLLSRLQIKTIIDLRSKTELLQIASRKATTTAQPNTTATASAPLLTSKTPALPIMRINLNGALYSLHLILSLPFLSALKLISLYLTGQRVPAIRILSTVLGPKGLSGLAEDSLLHSWREIKSIFALLADESRWPVLVHCTQGKDRTGLVVLLVLMLCGVERQAVEADYMATAPALEGAEREGRVKEIKEVGLPESFADCEEGWVGSVWSFIEDRWGGVEGYLKWCGINEEDLECVRRRLLQDHGTKPS